MAGAHNRQEILQMIADRGGLRPGVATEIARVTGVPEAEVYGAGSFFHLLAEPDTNVRVCTGLSCALAGADELVAGARKRGLEVGECSCLAACDRAPAVLRARDVLGQVARGDFERMGEEPEALTSAACSDLDWRGDIGPIGADGGSLAINLAGEPDYSLAALARAKQLGPAAVIDALADSGLQGRGGAGFPAATKWRSIRAQSRRPRYVVLNADEGEPGTFKDRELMLRRPDRVLEGLAIAAVTLEADSVYLYLRGEFGAPRRALERALERIAGSHHLAGVEFHLHAGHGAYICGEETALLEALEGRRGMPRIKPPFPTERGLWGMPTLIQNVETIACVPAIIARGGQWFRDLGRTEPGTKLYSVSGHVEQPGTYELPLGICLDELVEAAGGYRGRLKAFSSGGASSGFLPAGERTRPLDFGSLGEVGSMLGSAGVVVLNETVHMVDAVRAQLRFFEAESCGQCGPCRMGTRFLSAALARFASAAGRVSPAQHLDLVDEVAWEMGEGSICGLGQTAPLPLTSAMAHFPEEFGLG